MTESAFADSEHWHVCILEPSGGKVLMRAIPCLQNLSLHKFLFIGLSTSLNGNAPHTPLRNILGTDAHMFLNQSMWDFNGLSNDKLKGFCLSNHIFSYMRGRRRCEYYKLVFKKALNDLHIFESQVGCASKASQSDDPSLFTRWRAIWFLFSPYPCKTLRQLSERYQFFQPMCISIFVLNYGNTVPEWADANLVTSLVVFKVNTGVTAFWGSRFSLGWREHWHSIKISLWTSSSFWEMGTYKA